jgi:hypothetical protein
MPPDDPWALFGSDDEGGPGGGGGGDDAAAASQGAAGEDEDAHRYGVGAKRQRAEGAAAAAAGGGGGNGDMIVGSRVRATAATAAEHAYFAASHRLWPVDSRGDVSAVAVTIDGLFNTLSADAAARLAGVAKRLRGFKPEGCAAATALSAAGAACASRDWAVGEVTGGCQVSE